MKPGMLHAPSMPWSSPTQPGVTWPSTCTSGSGPLVQSPKGGFWHQEEQNSQGQGLVPLIVNVAISLSF